MPEFVPVPWIRWQRFRITGLVVTEDSARAAEGLRVTAFDKDLVKDDFLGEAVTDAEGHFEIRFTDADFKDVLESQPDIYLCVFVPGQPTPIADTACEIRENASQEEYFRIEVPESVLARSGDRI